MSRVQIDQAGRIVLPKPLRERFRLERGDNLELEVKGEVIELRPLKPGLTIERVNGIMVICGDSPVPEDIVERSRNERIRDSFIEMGEK